MTEVQIITSRDEQPSPSTATETTSYNYFLDNGKTFGFKPLQKEVFVRNYQSSFNHIVFKIKNQYAK